MNKQTNKQTGIVVNVLTEGAKNVYTFQYLRKI